MYLSLTASASYRLAHIARTARALQSSTKTSLRIDAEGLLSLQFLMPSPKPRGGTSDAFVEFRVSLAVSISTPSDILTHGNG